MRDRVDCEWESNGRLWGRVIIMLLLCIMYIKKIRKKVERMKESGERTSEK